MYHLLIDPGHNAGDRIFEQMMQQTKLLQDKFLTYTHAMLARLWAGNQGGQDKRAERKNTPAKTGKTTKDKANRKQKGERKPNRPTPPHKEPDTTQKRKTEGTQTKTGNSGKQLSLS